jgi:hypothetical protein
MDLPSAIRLLDSHVDTIPSGLPRLERIARAGLRLSGGRGPLLGLLLAGASPTGCGGRRVLWPLWANEAMHRAYTLIRLVGLLAERSPEPHAGDTGLALELSLGAELADSYMALAIGRDEDMVPCSELLRSVVCGLVELFGPAAGDVFVKTYVERIKLPAFQRRALVLAASELVAESLLRAFHGRGAGRIEVEVAHVTPTRARLRVTDDGNRRSPCSPDRGVVHDLADLLETVPSYSHVVTGGTVAEIAFPVRPCHPRHANVPITRDNEKRPT